MSFNCMAWASKQKTGSGTRKLVLIMLADRTGDNDTCYPSMSKLSRDCELSRDTIIRAVKQLEKDGFIEIIHRTKDGTKLSNIYKLNVRGVVAQKVVGSSTERHKPINEPITDVSDNTSVNNKELKEQEQEHAQLWSDYSLGFLKRKGRSSSEIGSKAKSLSRYIQLCKKGISYSDIREVVNKEAGKSFGNKHLENILSPTYFKDHYNGV